MEKQKKGMQGRVKEGSQYLHLKETQAKISKNLFKEMESKRKLRSSESSVGS